MRSASFFDPDTKTCGLCPHSCRIEPDMTGYCGVRRNISGKLYTLNFGMLCAMNIDPIEKKPLYHFYPGESTLSIAAPGCNFSCRFCQNSEISQGPREGRVQGSAAEPDEVIKYASKTGVRIISYTYSEPTIFYEYAYDTAALAKESGLLNVWVSNGYISPDPLRKIAPLLDAANIDLKAFSDKTYRRMCHGSLSPVLDTIRTLKELGVWVEVTTLVVPGMNDSEEELSRIADFIASVDKDMPWHISRFHPDFRMIDTDPTPIKTLEDAYHIGRKVLSNVYVGNVFLPGSSDTYCPACGQIVMTRRGFSVTKGEACSCGHKLAGRF